MTMTRQLAFTTFEEQFNMIQVDSVVDIDHVVADDPCMISL